jgi:DNA-binding response OmpR family regulator
MSRFRILVAEDDPSIRTGLIATLESEGYEVDAAKDGAAAVRLFGREKFDLVLLDIMMPELNGYDVCREIRKKDARTPVIMLTAKGEEIDKVLGLELGADDYVTKPFGIHELLAGWRPPFEDRWSPPITRGRSLNGFPWATGW